MPSPPDACIRSLWARKLWARIPWARMALLLPAVLAGTLLLPGPARAADALVAVAANVAPAMNELAALFTRTSGHRLQATTGSTGKLYAQIFHGAPFDVLLSADAATPERLEAEGRAVAGTRFTYAIGRLALWSSDAGRIGDDARAALTAPDVRHIAIANPDLAPYGAAAREVLENLDLWEHSRDRIAMGQNIGQVHAMVATGNAQLGFVALSALLTANAEDEGSRWLVPESLHMPIRQDAVLLSPGRENAAARAFLEFLATPQAREVLLRHGYGSE